MGLTQIGTPRPNRESYKPPVLSRRKVLLQEPRMVPTIYTYLTHNKFAAEIYSKNCVSCAVLADVGLAR